MNDFLAIQNQVICVYQVGKASQTYIVKLSKYLNLEAIVLENLIDCVVVVVEICVFLMV